jgi:hypothetical protein
VIPCGALRKESAMSQLFARIELRGTPGEDVYNKLHAYMEAKNWFRTITGTKTVALPHATYQATFGDVPDLMKIADTLKIGIESTIWTKALVLVVQTANWAITAG